MPAAATTTTANRSRSANQPKSVSAEQFQSEAGSVVPLKPNDSSSPVQPTDASAAATAETVSKTQIVSENNQAADFADNFKLAPVRSIRAIVKDLSKPVAQRHLGFRKQGGKDITYISWYHAIKYLDYYAPGWFYEVRSMQSIGGKLIITVRLSIPCAEGLIYREATGQEDEDTSSFGDSSSNAESMALRRACVKFGLGAYLYEK